MKKIISALGLSVTIVAFSLIASVPTPAVAEAQTVTCPVGFTCTPVTTTPGCPVGFVCTPVTPVVNGAPAISSVTEVDKNTPGYLIGGAQNYVYGQNLTGISQVYLNTTSGDKNTYHLEYASAQGTSLNVVLPGNSYIPDGQYDLIIINSYGTSSPFLVNVSNSIPVTPAPSCYTWQSDLHVGSRGTDVVALQTWLIANGFDIPFISNGIASKGYFGPSTATALAKYQTSVGISPANGYFGPVTRAALNGSCTVTQPSGNNVNLSLDSASPLASTVQVTDTTNNQYLGLPLLVFDLAAPNTPGLSPMSLQSLTVNMQGGKGTGTVSAAYLYQGSNLLASAAASPNGLFNFVFNNINYTLSPGITAPFTVKVDVTNISGGIQLSASIGGVNVVSSQFKGGATLGVAGVANGNWITVSNSVGGLQVSNTSATLGSPIVGTVGGTQTTTGYNASFSYTLTAGNTPVYVSNGNTSMCPSGYTCVTAGPALFGGTIMPSAGVAVTANPGQLAGDGSNYYIIPPGASRQFTISTAFQASSVSGAGFYTSAITAIQYGTSASNLTANSITSGLDNLKVGMTLNGTGQSTCPTNYICTAPGQTTTCPAGYTCTVVTTNCPSGYTCYNQIPTITVLSPSSQVTVAVGESMNVSWNSSNPTQAVDVYIVDASKRTVTQALGIVPSNANAQSVGFTTNGLFVPVVGQVYSARVCIAGSTNCSYSNGSFLIAPAVTNVSPYVSQVLPQPVQVGSSLTVYTSNAGHQGNIILQTQDGLKSWTDGYYSTGSNSSNGFAVYDGSKLSFTVPSTIGRGVNPGYWNEPTVPITTGVYNLYINALDANNNFVKSNVISVSITASSASQPPTISGGTFPTTLTVGQTGSWMVNASDPQNGSLSYSVNWGDAPTCTPGYICEMSKVSAPVQSSSFTHSYATAGTYTVTFTVTNSAGLSAKTSTTVQVTNPVTVQPTISIISLNGGQTYALNTPIPISWYMNYNSGATSMVVFLYSPTLGNVFRSQPLIGMVGSNQWTIPLNAAPSAGQYKVEVCDNNQSPAGLPGKSLCSLSANYFTITAPNSSNAYNYTASPANNTASVWDAIWSSVRDYLGAH